MKDGLVGLAAAGCATAGIVAGPTSDITDAFALGVSATFEHVSISIDGAAQLSVDLGPFPAPENLPDSF